LLSNDVKIPRLARAVFLIFILSSAFLLELALTKLRNLGLSTTLFLPTILLSNSLISPDLLTLLLLYKMLMFLVMTLGGLCAIDDSADRGINDYLF
jgi:hypothetical protein